MIRGKDYIGIAVGCIISKGDQVLLIKRAEEPYEGSWALPAGKVEIGETAKQAIIREVKEEVHLSIDPKFLFYFDSFEKKLELHFLELWFAATSENTPHETKEVSEIKFVPLLELNKVKLAFNQNEIIKRYLAMKVKA